MRCLLSILIVCLSLVGTQGYQTYRNVKDFGAAGNGNQDDTAAIINALVSGRGDGGGIWPNAKYSESTTTPAYVYFPGGTYIVSQPLPFIYYTQIVGDPDNLPVIKYVSSVKNQRVFEVAGDWYTGVNQNNFYRMLRNVVVDMTACASCVGIHWQVAQATSITNVLFRAGAGTQNVGMWMENGSGGFFSDVTFDGGLYGMWVGNQQFTSRNLTFKNAGAAGIYLNWDWIWTFSQLNVQNCPVGVDIANNGGSAAIVDSTFNNVPIIVRTAFNANPINSQGSILVDNIIVNSNAVVVTNGDNVQLKANGGSVVKSWAQGNIWNNNQHTISSVDLSSVTPARPASLIDSTGAFFQMQRPLFRGINQIDVTTIGILPNTDITSAFQNALNSNAGRSVLFFPSGIYHISNTIFIPAGTRLLGQVWSTLMADGQAFQNANSPVPMLKVGNAGDLGIAQLVDLMISTNGPQPGAKLIEWNMHDPAGAPGSCGMWDTHFRIGGADGTNLHPGNCPFGDGHDAPASVCTGAWGLMHITRSGSCYMENVWGWTADHSIDEHTQINVYNHRGFLCESQGPVWMYGCAMEHSVLYQYNFYGASNIYMGAIQTETPYYQPSTQTPFVLSDTHPADPTFCTNQAICNMAYALLITGSSNIYLYGAGLYSFFNTWNQDCLNGQPHCQQNMVKITNSKQIFTYAMNTYGGNYMLTENEPYSRAADNNSTFCSSVIVNLNLFGGQINTIGTATSGTATSGTATSGTATSGTATSGTVTSGNTGSVTSGNTGTVTSGNTGTVTSGNTVTSTSGNNHGCPQGTCPSQLSCCNSFYSGPACYDANSNDCTTNDQGHQVLCAKGQQSCGTSCYSPNLYRCNNGQLGPR